MGYKPNPHDHAGDVGYHPASVGHDAEDREVLALAKRAEAALVERLAREAERIVHPDVNGTVRVPGRIDQMHVGGEVLRNLAGCELVAAGVNETQRIRTI